MINFVPEERVNDMKRKTAKEILTAEVYEQSVPEQDHFNWVKRHLCLIEQIGIENYIIEMLGE